MALQLGPVIGQIGGVVVQSQPVAWDTTSASAGSTTVVATINTGSVGNWRIVLVGVESQHSRSGTTNPAELVVNGQTLGVMGSGTPGMTGFSAVVANTSLITVSVTRNAASSTTASVWSGTAFWWPED